ncbi:MAG: hypothetical protein OEY64_02155 [Nitrospinota bacterium]|nr:hypothetical protein [Nitrospinota bacterium]
MFTRRELIKTSIAGGILLAAIRVAHGPFKYDPVAPEDTEYSFYFLTEKDRAVVVALSPVILAIDPAGNGERINDIVSGVDRAISGLLPSVQSEVRDLFNILNFPITRRLLCGVWQPWLLAEVDDIDRFLSSWQHSRFLLLRSGYQALHELVTASWYGNPRSWVEIGYERPPDLGEIE